MATPLPTSDEFFGAAKLPAADEFFAPPAQVGGNLGDAFLGVSEADGAHGYEPVKRVLDAISGGVTGAFSGEIGLSKETEQSLKDAGVFNDAEKGRTSVMRSVNEAFMRPAATAIDTIMRLGGAGLGAFQAGIAQTGAELGVPQLGRDIAAMPEAFFGSPGGLRAPEPRALPLVGTSDAEFIRGIDATVRKGLEPSQEGIRPREAPPPAEPPPATEPAAPAEPTPAPDIHTVARQVDPEAFGGPRGYDTLTTQRDTFRRWLDELAESRQREAEASAPHAEEIADLRARLADEDTTPRNRKKYEARLEPLVEANEAAIDKATRRDTPDMARIRAELQKTDFAMRDVAERVSAAYREAETRMPADVSRETAPPEPVQAAPAVEGAPVAPATPEPATVLPAAPAEPVPAEAAQQPAKPMVVGEAPPTERVGAGIKIADDVAGKLVKAGRPAEEAGAAAQIVSAYHETRARRLGITAAESYSETAPEIRAGVKRGAGRIKELGTLGHTKFNEASTIVTLFKSADASTFMHEMGHVWLEDLMDDASDPRANAELRADAKAVQDWLKISNDIEGNVGKIATRAHEKFARSFERYLYEGHAPSQALARVFGQFKQWMSGVYSRLTNLAVGGKLPKISDDIRAVFDRMLASPEERTVVAPEREARGMVERHERAAEETPPEIAEAVADEVRAEADTTLGDTAPEVADEVGGRGGSEAGGDAAAGARPDGDRPAGQPDVGAAPGGAGGGAVGAGGGEAPAQGARARAESLYVKVPPAPPSLVDFLKSIGGLKDDHFARFEATERGRADAARNPSELRTIGAHDVRGLVRPKSGISLEMAAERAHEAGYFPELGPFEPGNVAGKNELLAALADELGGKKRYSEVDADRLRAHREAVEGNAAVDEQLSQLGIDPKGKTRAEVFDEIAKKRSIEETRRLIDEQVAAHIEKMREAEDARVEWLERHGEEAPVRDSVPRTEEDLEREIREEESSAGAPAGARADVGPEDAAARPGRGETGEGRGGTGAGAGQRNRAQAGRGQPDVTNEHERLGGAETRLIDRAGNIRLDNLGTPEDVDQVIREAAAANDDFIGARRGIVSDAQVDSLADALGMDETPLLRRRLGEAFNAERIIQARRLLIQSATSVRDAMGRAAEGSDADLMAYASAKLRHRMIQEQVAGITAEAGRALRAFRALEGQQEAAAIGQFVQEATGRTLNQLRREAQLGLKLETPAQVSAFVDKASQPTWKDMAVEAWMSVRLSGIRTHVANLLGNTISAVVRPVETAGAAGVGAVRHLFTGTEDRVLFREASAELFGMVQGAREGVTAGWEAFKTEKPQFSATTQTEKQIRSIPGVAGQVIRTPLRALLAEDEFFKAVNFRSSINRQAYSAAAGEGLAGDALARRVADLSTNPTDEMIAEGKRVADYMTFQSPLGKTGRAVSQLSNSHILAKLIVPFVRTPINLLKYAGERTPLGLFSEEVRANLRGTNGAEARDTQIARMAIGTMIGATAFSLAGEGSLTGGGPADPDKRALMKTAGIQPYSVRIGEMYYSYERLDPFSVILGLSADAYEVAHAVSADHPDAQHIPSLIFASVTKNVLNRASLSGISDLVQAIQEPERYGPRYLIGQADFTPAIFAQTAQQLDPVQREARTLLDSYRSHLPGLSSSLIPRRDIWGEPLERDALGPIMVSPIAAQRWKGDPVTEAILKTHYAPAPVQRKILQVELTDQQHDDYARIAGRMAHMALEQQGVGSPAFGQLPVPAQEELVRKTVEKTREAAAAIVKAQSIGTPDDIVAKAIKSKEAFVEGGREARAAALKR